MAEIANTPKVVINMQFLNEMSEWFEIIIIQFGIYRNYITLPIREVS